MRKDEITQGAVMQVVLHGQRYQVDDFGRIDAKQGTAYYAPRMRVDAFIIPSMCCNVRARGMAAAGSRDTWSE